MFFVQMYFFHMILKSYLGKFQGRIQTIQLMILVCLGIVIEMVGNMGSRGGKIILTNW